MKYVISLLITMNAWATPIRVFHEGEARYAEGIKTTMKFEYSLPDDLIHIEQVKSCSELVVRGKLDLCLKSNGDLLVVSVDREFVSESLKIFRAP
ncbi:MAG TPA: hypothetical protein VNJ08_07470 [Bacteriovoracaceae bacterium]|nr:hypothetical protein [Bacteriovoracaceae bacterium]